MSSPNHLTSGIEDTFSSNFHRLYPSFLGYVPSFTGKNFFCLQKNSLESPIPPPTIMPPSPMLSAMFNPQESFLPKELLPPKKQGRDRSFSATSVLPQEFETG
ncbi:hypothetical protein Tco_0972475 [Tanacetum coccineum]